MSQKSAEICTTQTDSQPGRVKPDRLLVFDGVCLLCSRWVHFVLKHDSLSRYHFASMQSAAGRDLLCSHGLDPDSPTSLLLVADGHGYTDTIAIARVLRTLDQRRWHFLSRTLLLIPAWLRDPVYRFVARHRYTIFGRSSDCFVPTQEQMGRFIS